MGLATGVSQAIPPSAVSCRLVVRKAEGFGEIVQFVTSGLQVGQQVVAMADAGCLKDLAHNLADAGLRPRALLRNGRLVFLTAPDCLSQLFRREDLFQRGPLRHGGPLVRWVSDWSWAYAYHSTVDLVQHQRRVHDFVRSLGALSLCTVRSGHLARAALLAVLAEHRRAARSQERPSSPLPV